MSEVLKGDKPQPGDRVRATLPDVDGVLVAADGQGVQLRTDDGTVHHFPGADIQVLERADGPAKDLIGTCRREEQDDVFAVYQCITGRDGDGTRWVCTHASNPNRVGRLWGHAYVARFPACGAAPGTPAAEAEKRENAVNAAVLREKIRREEAKLNVCRVDESAGADEHENCRASEGATGIECALSRYHPLVVDHEGTHVPNESCAYPLFVRWPWQQYDRDAAAVGFEVTP